MRFWHTLPHQWISFTSGLFEGPTTRWLESVQRRAPHATWVDFCNLRQSIFGHNRHQKLLRQMFHIRKTESVEDYVERFSQLYDQISVYEEEPNTVHYVTRFMEGLTPSVRLLVGIQQPEDLDSAYALAVLSEELGDTSSKYSPSTSDVVIRRPFVPAAKTMLPKPADEKKTPDIPRAIPEDRLSALRAYRNPRGCVLLVVRNGVEITSANNRFNCMLFRKC